MPMIQMRELQLAARGRSVTLGSPSGIPSHILGMVSSVRGAVRRVHLESPGAGVAKVKATLDKYLAGASSSNPGKKGTATAASHYIEAVEACAEWHGACGLEVEKWQLRGVTQYGSGDAVDVMVRVVLKDPNTGKYVGRVILWDQYNLDANSALIIAAAAVPILDDTYAPDDVDRIEVWGCGLAQQHVISADDARAASGQVAALVASM